MDIDSELEAHSTNEPGQARPGSCTDGRFHSFQDHEEILPPFIAFSLGTAFASLFDPYERGGN
jgi:hypothetical protein